MQELKVVPVHQTAVGLTERFDHVRAFTLALSASLSDADATVQSMPEASPAKWHLAHTTWFFESFILGEHVCGYRPFDPTFALLFNSYYEAKGTRIARGARGLLTRPSLDDIRCYRRHVDAALRAALGDLPPAAQGLVELGCHHEEQHQELLLTDVLHLFAQNPLAPAVWPPVARTPGGLAGPMRWREGAQGPVEIGHGGPGFAFDCEGPRHKVWLTPHALADRVVTNGEWLQFMQAGGYDRPDFWLSDGWAWVRENGIEAPLYWRRDAAGAWSSHFGLDGLGPIEWAAPVAHVSYYEADAFARWCGARLPTEAEWESAARTARSDVGVLLDRAGPVRPLPANEEGRLRQAYGDVWEWTASAYLPYPGFRPAAGAVGEYNGKFMSGQFVLRGGSCATPRGHVRASYRNFFYPQQRWQFTGVRLAKDL